ncbi:MAG: hypothetical protein J5548_01355 [Prevotella sp.]|nr:hypothetical protein [Prevotella sp.]
MRLPGWPKGNVSRQVLYLLVTVTVVIFALFYFVGYSHPWAEDPDFIEPRLTTTLIIFVFFVLALALAVTVWAVFSAIRKRGRKDNTSHRVPVTIITIGMVAFIVILLGVSFVIGSSSAITVNGKAYEEAGWLKAADMFVISSLVLMVIATAAVAFATIKSYLNNRK